LSEKSAAAAEDSFKIPAGQERVNGKRRNICWQQLIYTTDRVSFLTTALSPFRFFVRVLGSGSGLLILGFGF